MRWHLMGVALAGTLGTGLALAVAGPSPAEAPGLAVL